MSSFARRRRRLLDYIYKVTVRRGQSLRFCLYEAGRCRLLIKVQLLGGKSCRSIDIYESGGDGLISWVI